MCQQKFVSTGLGKTSVRLISCMVTLKRFCMDLFRERRVLINEKSKQFVQATLNFYR